MKQHIKLLAKLPEIDAILAVESLLPWGGDYNVDAEDGELRTFTSEASEHLKLMTQVIGDHYIEVRAEMRGDTIVVTANEAAVHATHLCNLFAAMGLKPSKLNQGFQLCSMDVEAFDSRISKLDGVWCLMRRIRIFENDMAKATESATKVLQFANEWSANRALTINGPIPNERAHERQTEDLEAQARNFERWEIKGLQSITLMHDPRGSILELGFDGYQGMSVLASKLDWATALTVGQFSENARVQVYGKYDIRPTRIAEDVQGELNGLVVSGNTVKIVEKLPKKLYDKLNELLSAIGGQWTTSVQAHVFNEDPAPLIDELIEKGSIFTRKDYEFFETQPPEVSRVIQKAGIEAGMKVLEPEAGRGALALAAAEIVGKCNVTCIELMPQNLAHLRHLGFEVGHPQDFLKVTPNAVYDRVVLNPPFSGGKDAAHIRHAMEFLKPGGVLVAIASTQWQTHDTKPAKDFRSFLAAAGAEIESIQAGAFKDSGTMVATTLITIRKPGVVPASTNVAEALEDPLACLL